MYWELWTADILGPYMAKAPEFRFVIAVHGVIRMTSEAGHFARYPIVLKVGRWNPGGIIDQKTAAVRLHDVTGETEFRRLRLFHVTVEPGPSPNRRQHEKRQKRQDLSVPAANGTGHRDDAGDEENRNPEKT